MGMGVVVMGVLVGIDVVLMGVWMGMGMGVWMGVLATGPPVTGPPVTPMVLLFLRVWFHTLYVGFWPFFKHP